MMHLQILIIIFGLAVCVLFIYCLHLKYKIEMFKQVTRYHTARLIKQAARKSSDQLMGQFKVMVAKECLEDLERITE